MRRYGPWIYSFAKRLTEGRADAGDITLLETILASAQEAGYERAEFFSHQKTPRLLVWPIQAFLIELCLGGKQSWCSVNLVPPVELMRREIRRRRTQQIGGGTGVANVYKKYLRSNWQRIVQQSHHPIPPAIRRIQHASKIPSGSR